MTMRVKTLTTSSSNAVRTIVGAYNACGHELEGIGVQGSNSISIYESLHMVSTGLTLEKKPKLLAITTETGFNDAKNQNLSLKLPSRLSLTKIATQSPVAQMVSRICN